MVGGTVTNRYQGGRPTQKNHVKRVRRRLPNSTRIMGTLCSRCETHWWFWIGLPTLTI